MRATLIRIYYSEEEDINQTRVAGVQVDFDHGPGSNAASSRGISFTPSGKLSAMTVAELVEEAVDHLNRGDKAWAMQLLEK